MSPPVLLTPASHTPGMVVPEDPAHPLDDPPDEGLEHVAGLPLESNFTKHMPRVTSFSRRESLLTQQLHASEAESHDEEPAHNGVRTMSHSSAAELTSDNDLTSPGTRCSTPSPPLPPTNITLPVSPLHKPLAAEPVIVGHDASNQTAEQIERNVETGLGRRRCITFACGGAKKTEESKDTTKATDSTVTPTVEQAPKRKCALTFVCPTRTKVAAQKPSPTAVTHVSPSSVRAAKSPRSPRSLATKQHRNSDATVTNLSPVALRKVPSTLYKRRKAKYADAVDEDSRDAKRFHEFAIHSKADDDWTEVSTVHRSRLTINDTLRKENAIRQMGQEVEDEANEDEDDEAILDELDAEEALSDDDEDEDEAEDPAHDDDDEDDDGNDAENVERTSAEGQDDDPAVAVSDAGFSTDDEGGFACSSESDGEGSDYEWWAPGRSTAATSTDQLDLVRPAYHRKMSDSSLESAREANDIVMQRNKRAHRKVHGKSGAVKIDRAPTPELPDSTDFVCGTLDEDRPLEQAYLSCLKERKAARHKAIPQDIDPTFPTSDFEHDDEEDEASDHRASEVDASDIAPFAPGKMDLFDDRRRGRDSSRTKKRSPLPSPRRLRSPPPNNRLALRSPAPKPRRASLISPPHLPPPRGRCRSPPPRKLFTRSPVRLRSPPPPSKRLTSPPNSRSTSLEGPPTPTQHTRPAIGLASRPAIDHAASLPRVPTMTSIHRFGIAANDEDDVDADDAYNNTRRHRGAIDIVKGLEKKRARRKEKLYQKQCQKAKKDVEKRCKPGKGAERMRELGLELAAYRGRKAEHILSI